MESFIQVEADEPANEPLTADELAKQLKMSATVQIAEADRLSMLAAAVCSNCETFTGRRLIEQYVDWVIDSFYPSNRCDGNVIRLPFANVTEIVSITYLDENGAEQSLSVVQDEDIRYVLPTGPKCGRGTIEPAYNETWPATRCVSGAVTIRLKAGYGPDPDDVPSALKMGMLALAAHLDRNREAVNVGNIVTPLPMGVKYLWMPFRTS